MLSWQHLDPVASGDTPSHKPTSSVSVRVLQRQTNTLEQAGSGSETSGSNLNPNSTARASQAHAEAALNPLMSQVNCRILCVVGVSSLVVKLGYSLQLRVAAWLPA